MEPETAILPSHVTSPGAVLGSTGSMLPRSGSGGGLLHEREVVRSAGRDAISSFLDSHNCFSVLRASGKCVVFDTKIPIQLAFYALVEHGMFSALFYFIALHCIVLLIATYSILLYALPELDESHFHFHIHSQNIT